MNKLISSKLYMIVNCPYMANRIFTFAKKNSGLETIFNTFLYTHEDDQNH